MRRAGRLGRTSWLLLMCVLCVLGVTDCRGDDWPQWGGPQRDLVWRETGILDRLPAGKPLPRMWSVPIAEGYAGPAVADGRVYVMDRVAEREIERVWCVSAETGEEIWKFEYQAKYKVDYPAGPRNTPVVVGDKVLTVGTMGHMHCLSTAEGRVLWKHEFVSEFDTKLPIWGMVASPLVLGEQVVTLVGGQPNALLMAFDLETGRELWRSLEDEGVGYCPPMLCRFGEREEIVQWHPQGVTAVEPTTGKKIWSIPFPVRFGLCIAQPRQVGNRLFLTAFYNGPLMLEVAADGSSAKVVWRGKSSSEVRTDGLHSIMSTPVFNGTHIYGVCSYGQLRCLDALDGKRLWETFEATGEGRWWNAFLVQQEDRFWLHNEQGELILARLTPEGFESLGRTQLIDPTREVQSRLTIWSQPAFAMKSVFARNDRELIRVNLAK